jgi:cardiolipin synthase
MRQLPNLLTLVRLLLTPAIVAGLLNGKCLMPLALSVFAGITDAFDGMLARRYNAVSQTGAYLDPVADKLLLVSLYVSFGVASIIPSWLVYLVVGRDLLIMVLVALGWALIGERRFPPSLWGKLSTLLQIGAAVLFLSRCLIVIPNALYDAVVYVVALATAWSGLHYTGRALAILRSHTRRG